MSIENIYLFWQNGTWKEEKEEVYSQIRLFVDIKAERRETESRKRDQNNVFNSREKKSESETENICRKNIKEKIPTKKDTNRSCWLISWF